MNSGLTGVVGSGSKASRSYAGTIVLPIGHSAMPANFRCAQAKGSPMMVTAQMIAVMRWPSASHQPASTN